MSVQTPISKAEEEKDPAAFSMPFRATPKFDQVHNAMFALAHEAFLAGFKPPKPPVFRYKGGQA